MSDTKQTRGSVIVAKDILERMAAGKLTNDPDKLAKYIEIACGIHYLANACQEALGLDAVGAEMETKLRAALAWAGYPEYPVHGQADGGAGDVKGGGA